MDDFNLACSFYVVYLIMIIQGVGTLLPWNMFITAHAVSTQYFIVHVLVTAYYANAFGKAFIWNFYNIVLSFQSYSQPNVPECNQLVVVNIKS